MEEKIIHLDDDEIEKVTGGKCQEIDGKLYFQCTRCKDWFLGADITNHIAACIRKYPPIFDLDGEPPL